MRDSTELTAPAVRLTMSHVGLVVHVDKAALAFNGSGSMELMCSIFGAPLKANRHGHCSAVHRS